MSYCCNNFMVATGTGKIWCAYCDREECDPTYQPEVEGCCSKPNITSSTYRDSCENCGYYYDYQTKTEGKV